jgi:hypothetical protein
MPHTSTTVQGYCDELLLALRSRVVPGARIGEVLAEVQSHVAETGEDPRTAFGSPRDYADEVADALGLTRSGVFAVLRSAIEWPDLLVSVLIGLSCFVLADGLWSLGAGDPGLFGLPAGLTTAVAAVVLAGGAVRTVGTGRRERDADAVIDPRTGADMVPFAGWRLALLAVVPGVFLLGTFIAGLLTR